MAKPIVHAISSAKKFGGVPEDYVEIHTFMDTSKGAIPDNRHRALTHTSWFLSTILERVFGTHFKNSDGRTIATRDIGEQHVLEDFQGRFIPTAQDFLQVMDIQEWMNNGNKGTPPSHQRIAETRRTRVVDLD